MTLEEEFNKIANCSLFRLDGERIDICDALVNICMSIIAEEETDWGIGENGEFTLDALIVGAYWAMTHCHGGQSSPEYATRCAISAIFSPGCECEPVKGTSERDVYDTICKHLVNNRFGLKKKKRK